MECEKCKSKRVLQMSAKCNDMCYTRFKDKEQDGYVPDDLPIGGGDYIEIDVCLECGTAQGVAGSDDPKFYN